MLSHFLRVKQSLRQTVRGLQAQRKVISQSDLDKIKVGDVVHGFQVKEIKPIEEFNIQAFYLQHEQTKAQYLHLYRNDNNNVFSINFRTTPMNSSGLPHILEHTVLCGSEKYPVRDPFFKMLNRSLATFMNAMTGSDYTIYPFSSQNLVDYQNLQKIYLDAVFKPNLNEMDFMQEGWRLENSKLDDKKSPIIIKGVVYNEMKGVFSENDNILAQKLQNYILPDHTYAVVSGGDPLEIPNLTHQDLVQFHRNHYHPSNCRFYSYGNFPLTPSLEYINDQYLSKYKLESSEHTQVPAQKRWTEPKRMHITGRFENMKEPFEKQNSITVSVLLSENTDPYHTLVSHFVSELLLKGPNSPFYKTLIEPNFSSGYANCTGYDNHQRDCIFTVGLQGLTENDFDKVLKLYEETIDSVIEKGFEPDHIESVLHKYELSLKHESKNFGLHLLFGLTPIWNHDGPILNALQANSLIGKLRNNLKENPRYFQDFVKANFKENKHQLILSMSPDKEFETKVQKEEKALIDKKVKELSDSDKEQVYEKALALFEKQKRKEDSNILPTLTMDDINPEVERIPTCHKVVSGVPTQINTVNSNGIVYFKALLSTLDLTQEQQMMLPLFCYVISKLGTQKLNYREFDNLINQKTAGLQLSVHVGESLYHLHTYKPAVLLSSYCLEKNLDDMFDIWRQVFEMTTLKDDKRFKMLTQLYLSELTSGIVDSGHFYAMQAASSLVSGSAYQKELLNGLHHISYMKRLIHTSNFRAMLVEISNIAKILFDKQRMSVALNISSENEDNIMSSYEQFVESLPIGIPLCSDSLYVTGKVWAPTDAIHCQHHVLNIPVNYCSKAVLTAPYTEPDFAKLRVLARLLSTKYLHPELREKQGAYGGGARLSPDGVFTFYTYRDPRSLESLDVFDESYRWMTQEMDKINEQDLLEAKLGVFQGIDTPVPPSNKGIQEFLKKLTPDVLQRHRAEVMHVNKNDLKVVGEKYLGEQNKLNSGKVVLGQRNDKADLGKRGDELWTVLDSI